MKKFLAVLLAVALLGVAGAAFAHGGEGGHVTTDDGAEFKLEITDATVLAKMKTMGYESLSSKDNYVGEGTASVPGDVEGVAIYDLKNLSKDVTYVFGASFENSSLKSKINEGSIKLYDADYAGGSVALAALAKNGKFYTSALEETTDLTKIAYAGFTATQETAKLYAAGTKKTDGPTSNKGSGGCNAGFASLAVLALSALALRRKAR